MFCMHVYRVPYMNDECYLQMIQIVLSVPDDENFRIYEQAMNTDEVKKGKILTIISESYLTNVECNVII